MRTIPEEIVRYEELILALALKYGERSNACLMAELNLLLQMLKGCEQRTGPRTAELVESIKRHYATEEQLVSSVAEYISVRESEDEGTLYSFSRDGYTYLYGDDFSVIDDNIIELTGNVETDGLCDGRWYLYVITADDRALVYDVPMSVADLVMNRNMSVPGQGPIVHPALAHGYEFTVKAAGEVAFSVLDGQICGIVANTKSGHFCPSPNSASVVERVFTHLFPGGAVLVTIPVTLRKLR